MKMTMQPTNHAGEVNEDRSNTQGNCDRCGALIRRFRGQSADLQCTCGAIYNICGQRLRDDLYTRPNRSSWDDDCDDLTGDEESYLRIDARLENMSQER